jgi:hypothetical protein
MTGDKYKAIVQWIAGGLDHLNEAFLDLFTQNPSAAAALSALHDTLAGKQQWFGNDAGFTVLIHVIFFGAAGLVHDLFMQQDHKPVVHRQTVKVFFFHGV